MIRIVVSALIVFGSAALASGQERPSEPPSEPPVLLEPVTVTAPPPFSASNSQLRAFWFGLGGTITTWV